MTALIVTESLFGNTLAIAEAIGDGIAEVRGPETVRVVHASEAPAELPSDVDLLVVGAPTHTALDAQRRHPPGRGPARVR